MLAHPAAAVAFLLLADGAAAAAAPKKTPTKIDFLRAMSKRQDFRRRKLSHAEFQAELHGASEASAKLRKKMIEKAIVSKPGERKLEDANGANYNANNNANYNAYKANYNGNYQKQYKYSANHDGADDYFQTYGEWENEFGFDITQFSASYMRCAAVKQFDAEVAATEDTDTVFTTKHFAVFRLCPEQTCMGWQEEDEDCGCEDQCEAIYENGNNNDYDEELCEEACAAQCDIWKQQISMWQGEDGGDRKLQNYYNNGSYNNNPYSSYSFDPYYGDDEDQELFGARGEGCQSNYGEYMIEIKDYLEMMLEWQEERFQRYQEYCEECMFLVYQEWVKNGGNRKLTYEEFKSSGEHRRLDNRQKYYKVCPEYDTCAEYQKINEVDNYSEYFECTEVEKNNGLVAYIGPHCAEDGFTITLGVYSDEECGNYIGNGVDIANFLGEEIDVEEDVLRAYYNSAWGPTLEQLQFVNEDNVCIPCRKSDNMWEQEPGQSQYNQDDQVQVNYDDNEVNELCENLYKVSARCDKHYRTYNSRTKQAKYAEAVAQEDLSCEFIDSVVMGNYDEMGGVDLGDNWRAQESSEGWTGMYGAQYGHYISEVTPLQIFGLIASIAAAGILAVWSVSLRKSLSKGGPWKPRRGLTAASPAAPDLDRQSSGIVMGRSQSNTSYYMS